MNSPFPISKSISKQSELINLDRWVGQRPSPFNLRCSCSHKLPCNPCRPCHPCHLGLPFIPPHQGSGFSRTPSAHYCILTKLVRLCGPQNLYRKYRYIKV